MAEVQPWSWRMGLVPTEVQGERLSGSPLPLFREEAAGGRPGERMESELLGSCPISRDPQCS